MEHVKRYLSKLFRPSRCSFDPQIGTNEATIDGILNPCEDLDVNSDVVLLVVVYELKSPGVGAFPKDGWVRFIGAPSPR